MPCARKLLNNEESNSMQWSRTLHHPASETVSYRANQLCTLQLSQERWYEGGGAAVECRLGRCCTMKLWQWQDGGIQRRRRGAIHSNHDHKHFVPHHEVMCTDSSHKELEIQINLPWSKTSLCKRSCLPLTVNKQLPLPSQWKRRSIRTLTE